MSFDTFNKDKDEIVKQNLKETIDHETKKEDEIHCVISSILKSNDMKSEKRKSVTFSLTESQIKKIEEQAQKHGFKTKSKLLAYLIDQM